MAYALWKYVSCYRLPCCRHTDGPVAVVAVELPLHASKMAETVLGLEGQPKGSHLTANFR